MEEEAAPKENDGRAVIRNVNTERKGNMSDDGYVSIEVKGLDELQKALEDLVDKDGNKYVRAAVNAGGNVVKDRIVQNAPKDSGLLADHIDKRTRKQKGEALAISALIGPNSKEVIHKQAKGKTSGLPRTAAAIAKMLEFGTKKMPKKPFMSQAWESSKQEALDALVAKLREKLGL